MHVQAVILTFNNNEISYLLHKTTFFMKTDATVRIPRKYMHYVSISIIFIANNILYENGCYINVKLHSDPLCTVGVVQNKLSLSIKSLVPLQTNIT